MRRHVNTVAENWQSTKEPMKAGNAPPAEAPTAASGLRGRQCELKGAILCLLKKRLRKATPYRVPSPNRFSSKLSKFPPTVHISIWPQLTEPQHDFSDSICCCIISELLAGALIGLSPLSSIMTDSFGKREVQRRIYYEGESIRNF